MLAQHERAERVRAEQSLDLRGIRVRDVLAARRDAGVVDEQVDRAEVVEHLGGERGGLVDVVDRRGERRRPAAERLDLRDRRGGGLLVAPVADRDVGAVLGERADGDPATGARTRATRRSPAAFRPGRPGPGRGPSVRSARAEPGRPLLEERGHRLFHVAREAREHLGAVLEVDPRPAGSRSPAGST